MKKNEFLNFAALSIAAFFCISGQSPRKELQLVPETVQSINHAETKQEKPLSQKTNQRKSAAQRSMEPDSQTSMNQKSAAKRSME